MSSFEERGFGYIHNAVIGTAMCLANQVGIFQALGNADRSLTSNEVALAGGLKERYVREILGCLSTADIVQVSKRDDGELQYTIDDDAKKALDGKLGAFSGFAGAMACIYSSVKDCFYKDGPVCVRYTDQVWNILDKFSQGNAPEIAQLFVGKVPDLQLQTQLGCHSDNTASIGKTRPIYNDHFVTLSDSETVYSSTEKGIDVFEFGSGKARLSATLAQQFPNSRFVASEVVPSVVAANKVNWAHIPNLSFSIVDVCSVPESPEKQFDWVFCVDVIHDLPDPLAALRGVKRMLAKPSGVFTFIDMATAGSPLEDKGNKSIAALYGLGTFFCVPESYQRENSQALGPCCGRQTMCDLVRKAGFELRDIMIEDPSALYICQLPAQC